MSAPIWFDSTETGAPVLNNAAGSLIALLRAVLVNGFNVRAITSIAVAGGVATVTCPGHGYSNAYGKWLEVRGASAPALNGVKQQTIVDANTFSYPAPGVADGTYTATDARRAPLGWEEQFVNGAATVAMYRRTAPEATAMMMRVNDSGVSPATVTDARILMVESATGIDAYSGEAPTAAQDSGGTRWFKGANTAAAKPWGIFGNERFLYVVLPGVNGTIGTFGYVVGAFGDLLPTLSNDAFHCIIAGSTVSVTTGNTNYPLPSTNSVNTAISQSSMVVCRGISQTGGALRVQTAGVGAAGGAMGSNSAGQTDISNLQVAAGALAIEEGSFFVRGVLPGLSWPLARAPFQALPQFSVIEPVLGANRRFASVLCSVNNAQGNILIDLDGPWH